MIIAKKKTTITARKSLGQNFLIDAEYINKIIHAISPKIDDMIIEIGPGLGALTEVILQQKIDLTVIEIDNRLPNMLRQLPFAAEHLKIVLQDVLTVDFNQFGSPIRVIGNLPYNISTPLIMHLFKYVEKIKDMHFMLQKEVVDRIVAEPGNRDYGRLSIITQYYCKPTLLFAVPSCAFEPVPKVESAFVRLRPYHESPYENVEQVKLFQVVAKAFAMRRKTVFNNLKSIISQHELANLNIDPSLRPENLSIADYIKITNFIHK